MPDRYKVADLDARELQPGHHGRFIHSEHTTHVYWEIQAGAELPDHSHPHEQIVNVLEGTIEMQVRGGELTRLGPGETFFESPDNIHEVSRNASSTEPAKFLVHILKTVGEPVTVPVE